MPSDREFEKAKDTVGPQPVAARGDSAQGKEGGALSDLSCTIRADEASERLDSFLGRRCADRSRSYFKKLIQDGFVLVNGHPVKAGYELRFGDEVSVRVSEEEKASDRLTPRPMPLDILYEDEDIPVP